MAEPLDKLDASLLEDTRNLERFYLTAGLSEKEVGLLFVRHAIYMLFKDGYYDDMSSEDAFERIADHLTNEVDNAVNQVSTLVEGAEEDRSL